MLEATVAIKMHIYTNVSTSTLHRIWKIEQTSRTTWYRVHILPTNHQILDSHSEIIYFFYNWNTFQGRARNDVDQLWTSTNLKFSKNKNSQMNATFCSRNIHKTPKLSSLNQVENCSTIETKYIALQFNTTFILRFWMLHTSWCVIYYAWFWSNLSEGTSSAHPSPTI